MTANHLATVVSRYLTSLDITFEEDRDGHAFHFDVTTSLDWRCVILIEEDPLALQVICRLPVRIPLQSVPAAHELVSSLNRRMRFGFWAVDENGRLAYRISQAVFGKRNHVEDLVEFSVDCALSTFARSAPSIARFALGNFDAESTLNHILLNALSTADPEDPAAAGIPLNNLHLN